VLTDQGTRRYGAEPPALIRSTANVVDLLLQDPLSTGDKFKCKDALGSFMNDDAGNPREHFLKVEFIAHYGTFNLYDMQSRCEYSTATELQQCKFASKQSITSTSTPVDEKDKLAQLEFWRDILTGYAGTTFIGTYQAVHRAMKHVYYKGNKQQNTARLRSRVYNALSSRKFPYEELLTAVSVNKDCDLDPTKFRLLKNITQIMHIVDMNDTPEIKHPEIMYSYPFYCTKLSRRPECHFGQFFSYEDTSDSIQIGGVEIFDIDVGESCNFVNPECAKIDVSVRAARGSVKLNTRARLSFYENTREAQGFTAFITPSNAAVKVVFYSVELLENLGPKSVILDYNTMHSKNRESVSVTVSDQGLTGAAGVAKVQNIMIEVGIVAVNDAPEISIARLEYAFLEDQLTQIEGLEVKDIDLNEGIESSLSRLTWQKPVASQITLNQIKYSLSVVYGVLRLGYSRNLRLVNIAEASFYTIQAGRFGHDTCRVNDIYNNLEALTAAAKDLQENDERYAKAKDGQGRVVGDYKRAIDMKTIKQYSEGLCLHANAQSAECPTGLEKLCACFGEFSCAVDGTITLYVNNSAPPFVMPPDKFDRRAEDEVKRSTWFDVLGRAVEVSDRTCGGMPTYPKPNNFTVGLSCQSDDDCGEAVLKPCAPGINCTCCANASQVCSTDSDCFIFDKGSSCGCVLGGPANGVCGPYCLDPKLTADCTSDLIGVDNAPRYYGRQCTYRAPFHNSKLPGSVEPAIRECRSGAYGIVGSPAQKILDLVGILSQGSKSITFIGDLIDVQRTLRNVNYITNLNYNRLFRPPVRERDPLTFDPEADNLDILSMSADDLGNAGGSELDQKSVHKQVNIRIEAVNDKPKANGPMRITVKEDLPFHFQRKTRTRLFVSDPDYSDYGFNLRVFTVNLTCSNGRLYLNETFLKMNGVANNRISFRYWTGSSMEKRGLHFEERSNIQPKYGNNCQLKPQCSDGVDITSEDSPYGFFKSEMYGLVYSPQTEGGRSQGCGICPENTGNRFISIEGVFDDINEALSFVTYLPDPHFNTRPVGREEFILFSVNDNGGLGNDASAPSLTDTLEISVLIESVNDRPIIGRKVSNLRNLITYSGGNDFPQSISDTAILAINQTLDSFCRGIPPSGTEYWEMCGPGKRQFIDIDEDTEFVITPDVLWIDDVDSEESRNMEEPRRYCCDPAGANGCRCGNPCTCEGRTCRCDTPKVCKTNDDRYQAGQLLVHIRVKQGLLRFFPPPGRDFFKQSDLVFLTNTTDLQIHENGNMEPCANQRECMVDVRQLNIRARKTFIQQGLSQMFLVYKGLPNYYGPDELSVWVSDGGFTDECYNATLVAKQTINIRVVGLNDAPVIEAPRGVMAYPRGLSCFADFHENQLTGTGLTTQCFNFPNASKLPPEPSERIRFLDQDIDDTPYGNLTVTIRLGNNAGHANAGQFTITQVIPNSQNWFDLYRDDEDCLNLQITGKIEDLNKLMHNLRYDAHPTFQGYVPIKIFAQDNKNFGECNGDHECGNLKKCGDHNKAEPHKPVAVGMADVVLDATIGDASGCSETDCVQCSRKMGCGFCPGVCPSQGGKCMTGTASGPTYETCPPNEQDQRKWNQCDTSSSSNTGVFAALAVVAFVLMVLSYLFLRWVRRRHATLMSYAKKLKADFKRAGRKAQILPPDDANYGSFFVLLAAAIITAIVFTIMSATVHADCNVNYKVFFDKASSIHMEVDACIVRFVPTRNRESPYKELKALFMNMAIMVDPEVLIDRDTCNLDAKVSVVNKRDESVKYVGYFCSMEMLVPDRMVIPKTTIVATGSNISYVRSGSMDRDSPQFGLEFGPNSFNLRGNHLVARLQNITASRFEYNVVNGNLIAIGVSFVTANFTSVSADMIVTTPKMTSVKFWQKSDNLVCLTAANNSLYVNDACNKVCEFKLSSRRTLQEEAQAFKESYASNDSHISLRRSVQLLTSVSAEQQLRKAPEALPWLCKPNGDGTQNCTQYDPKKAEEEDTCPVGAQYKKRSQVPKIDGCYDLTICSFDESAKCLCKPKCDMANLDPPGTCDDFGQCCQIICAGYSRADMFPKPNMPRCNYEQQYCEDRLEQKWMFTSTAGQISLEVVDDKLKQPHPKVSSYKGSAPSTKVEAKIDIVLADKKVLNEVFHPAGGNNPDSAWFSLRLKGPGAPEANDGEFVWLASVRYLVLPNWLLAFLSFGLLTPSKGASLSGLNPSFCPAFTPSTSALFLDRLVQVRQLLLDTVQNYPGPDKKAIPFTSLVAYKPVGGSPQKFMTDPATNKIGVSLVLPNDYPLVVGVVALAIAIPCLLVSVVLLVAIGSGYAMVKAYRMQKLKEEQLAANLHRVFTALANANEDEMPISDSKRIEMLSRTNMFYLFEDFVLACAEEQRSFLKEIIIVILELLIVIVPITIVYIMVDMLKGAYQADKCEFRSDTCPCYAESDGLLQIVGAVATLLQVFFLIAVAELTGYYLHFSYNLFRRILRILFYIGFFAIVWITAVLLLIVVLFVLLGILVKPTHLAPYGIAIVGTAACCAAYFAKQRKFQTRVERAVAKRVEMEKGKMNSVPPILLDLLINKNVQQALHEQGLSTSRIVVSVFSFGMCLLGTYVFLFIGFNAFTDPNDVISGFINSGVAFGVALGTHYAFSKDGDEEDVKDAVDQMQEQVMRTLKRVLDMVTRQLSLAMKLFKRMQVNIDDAAAGESSRASDDSSSSSDGK